MELSSFDVYNLVKESQFLVGAKVDNIYQLDTKDLYLQIYVKEKPKQLLRILAGKCFYLTSTRPEFPENMMRFCSYLRKYMLNARIKSLEQVDYERIIRIVLETKDSQYELYAELFGKGNIVVVKDGKIISVAEEQIWADRVLKNGEQYTYPQRENSKEVFEKFKQKGSTITMAVLDKEFAAELVSTRKASSAKDKEMKKIQNIIEKQTEQLEKVLRTAEENKHKGELIYVHYPELKKLLDAVQQMKGKPWDEIKKKMKGNKLFKDIKENILVVDV